MCKTKRANKVVSRKSHSITRPLLVQYEWQEVELEAYVDKRQVGQRFPLPKVAQLANQRSY